MSKTIVCLRASARRLTAVFIATLAAAVVLVALPSSGTTTASAASPSALSYLLTYTKGKHQAAKGTPVTIGWINQQGGLQSFPETTQAMHAAIDVLNAQDDGIDGHPLHVVSCFVASTAEQTQQCAEQFANDPSLLAVVPGLDVLGSTTLATTINGRIPIIGGQLLSPADTNDPDSFYVGSGPLGTLEGLTGYLATLKPQPHKIALLYTNLPQDAAITGQIVTELQAAKYAVTTSAVSPDGTDALAAVIASGAQSADVVMPLVETGNCAAVAGALSQVNIRKPIFSLSRCVDPSVSSALGDFPKWTYVFSTTNPFAGKEADTKAFLAAMKVYAPGAPTESSATPGFIGIMALARMANSVKGALTSATLTAAAQRFRGPGFMTPPAQQFGVAPDKAVGSIASKVYTYEGKGKWITANGGKWFQP